MDGVVHILVLLARHRFVVMSVGIVMPILLGLLMPQDAFSSRRSLFWLRLMLSICGLFTLINLLAGPTITSQLIYTCGASGTGRLTGEAPTATIYNNAHVWRYFVDVKASDGQVFGTTFESDDFNVYPPHNGTTYPEMGETFSVRYLRWFLGISWL